MKATTPLFGCGFFTKKKSSAALSCLKSQSCLITLAVGLVVLVAGCATTSAYKTAGNKTLSSKNAVEYQNLIPYQSFQLDNGLTVIVHEDNSAPLIAVNTWYKVGSKHEPKGKTGFAHLFEHLMFNGSEHYDKDLFIPLRQVGAVDLNGTTSSDRTNYFQTVPKEALDLALWLESDRMGHLLGAITQEKLDIQRGVVQNEKRIGQEKPYGEAYEIISKLSFPEGHPYSWTTIGSMEDLNAASLEDVHQWFKDFYGPNNAVLVLAGDIDVKTAKERVTHFYGDIAPSRFPHQPVAWVPSLAENKRYELTEQVPQKRLYRVWNTPELGTDASRTLELLGDILGNHASARLHKRLVLDEALALNLDIGHYTRPLSGQFWMIVDLKPEADIAYVERVIDQELNKLIDEGVSASELNRSVVRAKSGFFRQIELLGGHSGRANTLASGAVYLNDPGAYAKDLAFWDQITPKAMQQVTANWLTKPHITVVYHPEPQLTAKVEGADRRALPELQPAKPYSFPKFSQFELDNGLKVVALNRANVPIIEASLVFDAGFERDGQDHQGLAQLAMATMANSTQALDRVALASALNDVGAQLGVQVSLNNAYLNLSALKEYWEDSLGYFADIVMRPGLREEDVQLNLELMQADIESSEKNALSLAFRAFPALLYGANHPYGVTGAGKGFRETLANLDQSKVGEYVTQWIRPDNARLFVVGDFNPETLKSELNAQFKHWTKPKKPLVALKGPKAAIRKQPVLYFMDMPKATQSAIMAGQVMPGNESDSHWPLTIANEAFGNDFTSRLNMNIREDKGWTYFAYSRLNATRQMARWVMFSPVETDKTLPAIKEMQREFKEFIHRRPINQVELDEVKANAIRGLPGTLATNSSVLGLLQDMANENQLKQSYLEEKNARLIHFQLNDIRSDVKRHMDTKRLVWLVVGDKAKVYDQLQKLKGLTVIEVDKRGRKLTD